jgi:hypothetical protein
MHLHYTCASNVMKNGIRYEAPRADHTSTGTPASM